MALLLPGAVSARKNRSEGASDEELTNFALGPEVAQWLVGPIARIASREERKSFLALVSDEAAKEFIERFWEARGPNLEFPPTGPRIVFERRAEEADTLFDEGSRIGRRTDRGTTYVLYGKPAEIFFESSPNPGGEPIEVWTYPEGWEKGLDGEEPKRFYSFRRAADGITRFHARPMERSRRRRPFGGAS